MAILNVDKKEIEDVIIENIVHDSSNILKTSYNYSTQQLVVTFKNGGVYTYNAVPPNLYEGFKTSESSGKYLNSNIINKYTASKKGKLDVDNINLLLTEVKKYKEPNGPIEH